MPAPCLLPNSCLFVYAVVVINNLINQGMSNLPEAMSPKENGFPSLGNHHLSVVPPVGWGLLSYSLIQVGIFCK